MKSNKKDKCLTLDKNIVVYDSGDDSLTFINASQDAIHTINTGLLLISLNKEEQIVALELMGAQKNFGIEKSVLKNLTKSRIELSLRKKLKTLIIKIYLYYKAEKPQIIINSIPFQGDHINNPVIEAKSCI